MGYPHYGPCIEVEHIRDQREWSEATFGPGPRLLGVLNHIRLELAEVENDPADASEWADLLILVIDGATRQGITAQQLIYAYRDKMRANYARDWPDWRGRSEDEPIEHIRTSDGA
jgi:hypothetical protein